MLTYPSEEGPWRPRAGIAGRADLVDIEDPTGMQFSWTVFLVVLGLGVVQLAAGVVVGRCVPIRRAKSVRDTEDRVGKLRQFARRLYELVNRMTEDVDKHQLEIQHVSQELASAQVGERGGVTDFVLKTVAEIMQVNERLHTRLNDAEGKLQEQAQQIESQLVEARTDPLTGLPNRRAFDDELARRVAEWRRKNTTFCLMMLDLDRFKLLNDRYGHPAGDYVLRGVAEVMRRTLREMDVAARIGGEEFAVILPSTNSVDALRAVQRMRRAVAAETFNFEDIQLRQTVSLGLSAVDVGDDSISLVKRADEALYAAKHGGRDCGYFHNGSTCLPIDRDDPTDSAIELSAVCDELRQRLVEVTKEQ